MAFQATPKAGHRIARLPVGANPVPIRLALPLRAPVWAKKIAVEVHVAQLDAPLAVLHSVALAGKQASAEREQGGVAVLS